jgi:hypothetical protein
MSSSAQSLVSWVDGQTLTAQALNDNFSALQAQITALQAAQATDLTLSTDDPRSDDLRWALLHAAATGACGGMGWPQESVARAVPKPTATSCTDVCEGLEQSCVSTISIGSILTRRASERGVVGAIARNSCGVGVDTIFRSDSFFEETVSDSLFGATAFDEVAATGAEVSGAALNTGPVAYCCCGDVDSDPVPSTSDNGSGP